MINVTYSFYAKEYCGTIIPDETALKQSVLKANSYLNGLMHRKPDEDKLPLVQLCLCEAAEIIYQDCSRRAEHKGREIQSENTDGYSVTYAIEAEAGKIAVNALQSKVYAILRRWLSSTGLLYTGVKLYGDQCSDYHL